MRKKSNRFAQAIDVEPGVCLVDTINMGRSYQLAIVSDIHYAGAAERSRGNDYEFRDLTSPAQRLFARYYRRYIWLHNPLEQWPLLDQFLDKVGPRDFLVANGDYSCDSAFIGVVDDAARASALECLQKLRQRFPNNFQATFGDHEIGKLSFFGARGGMRLASYRSACEALALQPFWQVELGQYLLIGVTSSLIALPAYLGDPLAEELPEWQGLREAHLVDIRRAFAAVEPGQKVLLFCHDPTALTFLWQEETVRAKLPQVEQTIIGHLHSNLVYFKSRLLAGMPTINFLGHAVKKMSHALSQSRCWKNFKVRLCPALAGVQIMKDGGFYTVELDSEARRPARFQFHRILR